MQLRKSLHAACQAKQTGAEGCLSRTRGHQTSMTDGTAQRCEGDRRAALRDTETAKGQATETANRIAKQ